MKYPFGDLMADYGFSFLEKLHSPIFLIHKTGSLKKVNEAGRKLMSVAHITAQELDHFIKMIIMPSMSLSPIDCQVLATKQKKFKIISKKLGSSDYLLVELIR